MPAVRALVPLLLAILLFAAGCANGPGGQSAAASGSLAYNGASAGDQTTTEGCGGSGKLHWSANLGSGSVTVRVIDAKGATVWTRTVSGPGQAAEESELGGAPGTWTLKAGRSSGFSGQYALHLAC